MTAPTSKYSFIFLLVLMLFPYDVVLACNDPKFKIMLNFKNYVGAWDGKWSSTQLNGVTEDGSTYKKFKATTGTRNSYVYGATLASGETHIELCELKDSGSGTSAFDFIVNGERACKVYVVTSKPETGNNDKSSNKLKVEVNLEIGDKAVVKCGTPDPDAWNNPYYMTKGYQAFTIPLTSIDDDD